MEIRRVEPMLGLIGNGRFLERLHAEMADKLRGLEDWVNDQNKDGSLDLTLKVKFSLGRDGLLRLKGEYDLKLPKEPASQGVAWLDNGALSPNNPNQMRFDLRNAAEPRHTYGGDVVDGWRVIEDGSNEPRRFAE